MDDRRESHEGPTEPSDAAAEPKGPLRRCIVTGAVGPKEEMIRFVLAPDGTVVPDVEGRLPGRGMWLSARRDVINTACARSQFTKAARAKVAVPPDLADRTEALLARRCLDLLGLARRAGQAVAGFEKVRDWLASGRTALWLEARDGSLEGRGKLRRIAPGLPMIDALSSAELAAALGRPHAVHVAVARGGLAERLRWDAARLAGLREVDPPAKAGRPGPKAMPEDAGRR